MFDTHLGGVSVGSTCWVELPLGGGPAPEPPASDLYTKGLRNLLDELDSGAPALPVRKAWDTVGEKFSVAPEFA